MTHSTIAQVFEFISQNPGFRATMGVVISHSAKETVLCWGAVKGAEHVVPELAVFQARWPDAIWMPLSEQQAQLFDEAWKDHGDKSLPSKNWSMTH